MSEEIGYLESYDESKALVKEEIADMPEEALDLLTWLSASGPAPCHATRPRGVY